jgi:hypothetical protein
MHKVRTSTAMSRSTSRACGQEVTSTLSPHLEEQGGHRDEQEHEQSMSLSQHEEEAGHREEQGTWLP